MKNWLLFIPKSGHTEVHYVELKLWLLSGQIFVKMVHFYSNIWSHCGPLILAKTVAPYWTTFEKKIITNSGHTEVHNVELKLWLHIGPILKNGLFFITNSGHTEVR